MNASYNWKTVLTGNACASILSWIDAKITQLLSASQQSNKINEVLLYGSGEDDKKKQLGLNNLLCVYYLLVHARQSIEVCMPSLDSDTISKCLINVRQKNNTKVRIVMHKNLDLNTKCFLDCGIEVKIISKAEARLEHEFMLIDAVDNLEEALAITGSLDYEVKRVNCDYDSTLLTSEKIVVSTFKREFDRIWNFLAVTEYNKSHNKNVIYEK